MSIWDTLFNRSPPPDPAAAPNYRFGRYTDAYKTPENYRAWNKSLTAFEEGEWLRSWEAFLEYLYDGEEDNLRWRQQEKTIYFELYQGSKRVTGMADGDQLRATARVARLLKPQRELLQRLTELNYSLKYSRYALDEEGHLTVIFDTPATDASPHKLYHALKEVAVQADKQDDLLLEEFANRLEPVEITHLHELSPEHKVVKRDFLTSHIDRLMDYLSSGELNPEQHPGAVAYLLLDLVYRLDYLLIPEGYTMEALERMHRMYFARETDQPVTYKNVRLLTELQELRRRAGESFAAELYGGKSTFGITLPANHDRLISLIDNELPNMDWYQDNGYGQVAQAIPGYIVGYALFNYAVPPPDRALLHLYYRVVENEYFGRLGYATGLLDNDGRPSRRLIRAEISALVKKYSATYPHFRPATGGLRYDNLVDFGRSYMEMVRELDLGMV